MKFKSSNFLHSDINAPGETETCGSNELRQRNTRSKPSLWLIVSSWQFGPIRTLAVTQAAGIPVWRTARIMGLVSLQSRTEERCKTSVFRVSFERP
jgi:hypothetical protein